MSNLYLNYIVLYGDVDVVPGRVWVAVRLRPRNSEELIADADFADCVELQSEVYLVFW